jgi:hypothetical protein
MIHDEDFDNQVGFFLANRTLRENIKSMGMPTMAWVMWIGVSSPVGLFFYIKAGLRV